MSWNTKHGILGTIFTEVKRIIMKDPVNPEANEHFEYILTTQNITECYCKLFPVAWGCR